LREKFDGLFTSFVLASILIICLFHAFSVHALRNFESDVNAGAQGITQDSSSIKVIVILAEFPDAKHTIPRDDIYKRIFVDVKAYYDEVSYGRLSIEGDVIGDWVMMPKPFQYYGDLFSFSGAIQQKRIELARDVIRDVDSKVDFRGYDRAIIIVPNVSIVGYALTENFGTNDGATIKYCTVQREDQTSALFAHELGHTIGLPDLYDHVLRDQLKSGDGAIYVGPWCLMSTTWGGSVHFCAYSKLLGNLIDPKRMEIVQRGTTEVVTLQPLEVKTEALQIVKIPLSNERYYLVEIRRKIRLDKLLPDEGMLITLVDSSIQGDGFLKVIDAQTETKALGDATFDIRPGKNNVFADTDNNLAIIAILIKDDVYLICVTPVDKAEEVAKLSDLLNKAESEVSQADGAGFVSPSAKLLLQQAHEKLAAAHESLKLLKSTDVSQLSDDAVNLTDQAFAAERSHAELAEALAKARDAISLAEKEGRTNGLNEAKSLIAEATSALENGANYENSLVLAIKAKKAAETSIKSNGPLISYWYWIVIGIAIIAGTSSIIFWTRKTRR
jgi:M6 family metalloprotease-like protein